MSDEGGSLVRRSALAHAADYELVASGVFQFSDATYSVSFHEPGGLARCLDMITAAPRKPATPRLYLQAEGYTPHGPEWPPSNLRFDFDRDHQVAAAVLLVIDNSDTIRAWMTRGDAAADDVLLTHDSWNPQERRFPPESFITMTELREALTQWAFGEVFPPPAVNWQPIPDDEAGWF